MQRLADTSVSGIVSVQKRETDELKLKFVL